MERINKVQKQKSTKFSVQSVKITFILLNVTYPLIIPLIFLFILLKKG